MNRKELGAFGKLGERFGRLGGRPKNIAAMSEVELRSIADVFGSLRATARATGMSLQTICKYANGVRSVPIDAATRLRAAAIGIAITKAELALPPPKIKQKHRENVDWFKEGLIHRTVTGVMVRSKSEVIVADTLTRLGISYEYEKWVDGVEWSRLPDFTISVGGKIFYWEHLGMMWNETYANRWAEKLSWYKDHGYADRLIVSEETSDNGLVGHIDSFAIDRLARQRILGEVLT